MNELLPDKPNHRQGQRIGSAMLTDRLSGLAGYHGIAIGKLRRQMRAKPRSTGKITGFCRADFMQTAAQQAVMRRQTAIDGLKAARHGLPRCRHQLKLPELVPQTVNLQAALLCLIFFFTH